MNSPLSSGLTIPTNPAPTPQPVSSTPTQIYSNNDSFSPLESSLESYFSQKLYEQDSHFMATRPSTDAIPSQDYARRAMRASGLIAYVTSDLSPHRAKQSEATFGRTSPYRQDKYSGMLVGRALCANFGYAGDPITFIRNHGKTALNLELPQTGYHSANELYSLIGTTFATQQRNDFTKALQAEQARAKALEETRQRLLPGALTRAVTGNSITPDEDAALKACGITDDSLAKVRLLTGLSGLATVDPASGIQHNAANSLNGLSLLGLEHNASLKGFSLFDRNGLLKASQIIGSDEKARALYLNLMRIAGRNHRNSHYSPHFLSNFAQSTAELFLSTTRAFGDTAIDLGMNAAVGSASLFQEDGYASRYKALVHDATTAFQEGYEQREKELNLKHSDSALSRVAWNLQDFPTLIKEPIADTAPYLNLYTAIVAIGGKAVEEQNRAAANAKGDPNAGFWELGVIPTARAAIFGVSVYGTGWATGKLLGSLSNTSIGRSVAARVAISPKTNYAANVTEGIITEAVEEAVDAIGQEALEASGLVAERQKRQNWKQFTELMQDSQFWGADIGMNLVFGAFGYKGARSKSPYKDVLKQLGFSDKEQKSLQLDLVKAHMAGASQASIADLVREAVAKKEADNPELFKQRATSMVANAQQKEAIRAAAANGIRNHVLKQAHVSDMKLHDDNTYTVQRIVHTQDGKFELVEERFTEDQLNDWLASDVSRSVTAEILYLQSLVRGEQASRAAESAENTPFSRVVSMLNAPAELLSKLDGKTSFDADTLTLFSEYALEQINLRLASGQSQAEAAEFGTTGSTLGAVSRLASDFDSRVSHAIATGELQPGDIPQSNAYILPGATPGDNILMLARGEASAKDVAHDWLEGFARSRYLANPAYWQQALSALDADLLNSGISSKSLFSHSPSERSHLEYIEAFSHLAELSFLANHAALPLSDHSHGILDEVLDDLGAAQGGLELASQLQQYLTSDAAKNAVGEALDPLRGILTDAGAALTDLLAAAEASSPKDAADFIIHNQQNMDEDVRIRLADLAQSADAPPITNSAPINPTEIGVPEQATGGTPITVADLAKLNGLNADGTRPAPIGATYSRIDPKKNGLSLIGGLAHGLPDGSISGSAKLANITIHPTIGSIDPARIRPNADEKEVILFRKKDGSLQAIGGLAFLHHATTCGVENVPVRVYSSGKKYTPQWAAKTAAESAIRANLASTSQTLSYLSKHALTRDKARRSNLIPKDANGQELPSSRAAWLLLQHASKKTIADTISGRLSTAAALATIEDKAASLLKQAAQFSLPGFETSSFSVIGKKAKTWDKYTSKAFKGRDDGLMRAEISTRFAKVNIDTLDSKAVKAFRKLLRAAYNEDRTQLSKEHASWLENYGAALEKFKKAELDFIKNPTENTVQIAKEASKEKGKWQEAAYSVIVSFFNKNDINIKSYLSQNLLDALALDFINSAEEESSEVYELLSKIGNNKTERLEDVLSFPELYEAYPELKDIIVRFEMLDPGIGGYASDNSIVLSSSNENSWKYKTILLHEIQHIIQKIEGFARGGNPSTAREHAFLLATLYPETYSFLDDLSDHELYRRLAGEIEARNVATRSNFTEEERAAIPFNSTLEYPGESIVPSSFSISPARARRKYMPLSEAVKLEQYLAMEAYARRLYRDAQALAQANPKNKLDDAVRAAMHLRALLNAVFSTLPKEAQPWKALGHARKQIDSLTWAVSHSYADLDPHQAPGITPAEIEKYNQSGYRDRRQWLTNKLSRLIISVADSAARSIEAHACRTLLATAETTIKTLLPKYQKSGKERRGTTAADVFTKAVDFYNMFDWSTEKRSEELVSVSNTLNNPDITDAERIQAEKRRQAILAFAGLTRESLPRVKAGVELLLAYIQTGRLAWEQKLLEERRATEAIQEAIASLEPKIEHSATTAKESKKQGGFANLFTSFQNPTQTLNQLANLPGKVGAIYANIRTNLAMAEDNKTYAIQQAHQDAAAALDAILGCTTDPSISRQIKRATFLSEANERINTGITKPGRIKITTFQFSQQDIYHLLTLRQEQGEDAFRAELDKHRRKYATEDQLNDTIPYEEVFNDALSQLQSPEYRGGTIYVEHYGERDTAHEDTLTLTRLQAANLWLLAQQPSYSNKYDQEGNLIERGMLDTLGYTDAVIDQLEQFCGKQLIAYAIWKREYLNTTGLFEAYEEHMGLPFPKEENYWPGAFDNASNNAGIDALQTAYQGNGVYNMLIIRKKHLSEPNLTVDLEAAWEHAISQHYHYIHLSPITRQLRAITRDPDTRQRLRKIVGNATLDNLEVQVNALDGAPAQQLQAAAHANNLLSRFLKAWAKALLNMATGTTVKQVSAAAHALAHQGINLFNIAPKLLTATLTDITGHPLKPGHVTPRDIRQLTAFRVRFNREDLSTMASRLAPGETQGKLALIDLFGSRFLEYTDAWANSQAMAAVYNTEYDRAKTIMLAANNGAQLTPEQEQQLTQHCIETVAVTLKQTAQPLEREDKAAIVQQRNWAMNQNFFMMGEIISKIGCTVSLIKADYAKAYNLPPAQAAKLRRKAWLKGLTFYSGMGIASQALLAALSYAIGSAPDSDDEEFINWVLNNLAAGALGFSYINAIPIIGETFSSLVQSIPGTGGKFGVFATYATTGVGITYKDLQDLAKAINPDTPPEERLYAGSNSLRVLTTLTGFFCSGTKGGNFLYELFSAANNLNNLIRPALQHAKNSSKKESKKAKQELQSLKRQLRQIRSTKKVTSTS